MRMTVLDLGRDDGLSPVATPHGDDLSFQFLRLASSLLKIDTEMTHPSQAPRFNAGRRRIVKVELDDPTQTLDEAEGVLVQYCFKRNVTFPFPLSGRVRNCQLPYLLTPMQVAICPLDDLVKVDEFKLTCHHSEGEERHLRNSLSSN
jgi:hypothetical protein